MSDADFWESTPAQIAAIGERFEGRRQREEIGPAIICKTVCNLMGAKDIELKDFMPSAEKDKPKSLSPESLKSLAQVLALRFGGEVVTDGQ